VSFSQRANLARAQLLQRQHRHADAVNELHQALLADPDDAQAHAMLGISLLETGKPKEATAEAQQAVGLAPDLPYAHYALAYILLKRNWLDEALQAAREAVRLESFNPHHFSLLSAIEFERRNWPGALDQAENALAIDPDDTWATNLRAMALVKLGRRDEAAAAMGDALQRDPEDAVTHANTGWTYLHQGDHRNARHHFREALRLDPTDNWAKAGMVESLKSGFLPYKYLLLFWLWMSRLSGRTQWMIVLAGFFGHRFLVAIGQTSPLLALWVLPISLAYIAFVIATWIASPLLNLMLRLHPHGKYALSREQTIQANTIGILIAFCLVSIGLLFRYPHPAIVIVAIASGLMVIPVAGIFSCPEGWPRWTMLGITVALGLIGLGATAMAFVLETGDKNQLLRLFLMGILGSQFAANGLRMAQPRR
jgi:Flp pilus assembly protein TadD